MTGSKEKSAFPVFAYALMPASYLLLVMGGGIMRSLGLLFGRCLENPNSSLCFSQYYFVR
jgi:hypothetical protein